MKIGISLITLMITWGCGSRKKEDLAPDAPNTQNPQSAPQMGVSSGGVPQAQGCGPLDLVPQVVLNATQNTKTASFKGVFPTTCPGKNSVLSLYIQASGELKLDPNYGCNTFGGRPPFTIRCRGPQLALDPTGLLAVTLSGDGQWDPLSIKLQGAFESP